MVGTLPTVMAAAVTGTTGRPHQLKALPPTVLGFLTCWATSGSGHARRTNGLTVEVRIGALIRRNMIPSAAVLGFTNRDGYVRRIEDLPCHIFAHSSMAFALPGANSFKYKIIFLIIYIINHNTILFHDTCPITILYLK